MSSAEAPPWRVSALDEVTVRRPANLCVHFRTRRVVDIAQLLKGSIDLGVEEQICASCPPGTEIQKVTSQEVGVLMETPAETWTPVADLVESSSSSAEVIHGLVERGLLLCSSGGARGTASIEKDHRLATLGWDPQAALYHYSSKWRDVDTTMGRETPAPLDLDRRGPCPEAFYKAPGSQNSVTLPVASLEGNRLHELLLRRRTTRHYDTERPLGFKALSTVLRATFGCHGLRPLDPTQTCRKTSPSGGGLHPIEAYPLICNVEGVEPGLYHYDVAEHALKLLRPVARTEAPRLAYRFTAGQTWFASAPVLFVMAARFARNYWKYRENSKAYKVLLMDAGHLSQTNYLVCTELGLGAFFTAAVNDAFIEEELGLDPLEQGVVGIAGCGYPAEEQPLRLLTEPYDPSPRRGP